MKRPTTFKSVLVVLFFIQSFLVFSQKDFTVRFDTSLKGDMLLIGNNILNRNENRDNERQNDPYNGTDKNNNDFDMQYVDIDNDPTTFSSSMARLKVPTASRECYKIVYAGLYWAGIYSQGAVNNGSVNRNNLGKVKFKLANETNYREITGSLIYDYYPGTSNGDQMPYAYYYDATSLIQGLANPEGDYTVADIISSRGRINGGFAAGWNLFVVYEDPKSSAKYITSYDGFRWIQASSPALTYNVSGFRTIPTGAVKAKLAFAALEGDINITGDRYAVNGTSISTPERPINNFFNSTINDISGPFTDRHLNSANTLGFDASIITLNNASNSIIRNNDTSANLTLSTNGDGYGVFFNAFNVEIIEPKIVLTKIVKNSAGADIGGQNVNLGDQLTYEVGFENIGNDDARSLTIRDQLPINIIFNRPTDIIQLPTGVTVQSYDPVTRNIVFAVNNNIVEVGDTKQTIIFRVRVVPNCNMLDEACSNSIDNSAYATYRGRTNTSFQISDDPSINSIASCILVPKATNFLVGIDGCRFTENVTLCTDNVNLTAANGYSTYTWYSDEARTNQIGTGQTLNVRNPGVYYVYNLAPAPCRSIYQAFTVTRFGNTAVNPVIAFADQVVECPNDGKKLPNIFLCGANARREITTTISDASSLVWEKLDETSCTAVTNENCANESTSCSWNEVGRGANYSANQAGQFRLTINYAGGCFNRFYFNVFTNSLNATETHEDIICGVNGTITINGVPAGYEYALSVDPSGPIGTYQTSNVFSIATANSYTAHIRQVGVTSNPCVFTVPNILIRNRNLEISTTVTQPACYGDKGSIKVGALNIDPQYYYYLYEGSSTTPSISVGPVADSDHTFGNLNPGITYRVRVTNKPIVFTAPQTGPTCDVSANITIQHPLNPITASADLVTPLTPCGNGKIQINASGGNGAPYYYFINGSTTFETSNEIEFSAPGTYSVRVVDSQNCETTTSIAVTDNPKPVYNIVPPVNIDCYGATSQIIVNVTNPNGYALEYSKDNGVTFGSSSTFSNLEPGTYNIVVRYTLAGTTCTDPAQIVTIAGPASAVSASAGVGSLAGCTLSGLGGLLRITNVEGGSPGYMYSFDGGATWQTSAEKEVLPGTYNLAVRDSKNCVYQIPYTVKLDDKPADPVIDQNVNPTYNCDGTATATIVVNTPITTGITYTYEYYLQTGTDAPVPNTPITSNIFNNVPSGNHTVIVRYNIETVSSYSNLLQEDFGFGPDTTSPGINTTYYCWERQVVATQCNGGPEINDGDYTVTSDILHPFGSWLNPTDHTTGTKVGRGRYLAVNIGATIPKTANLYQKEIKDILPNQPISVEIYAINLLRDNNEYDPDLQLALVDKVTGNDISSVSTGNIPKSNNWEKYLLTLNPGAHTELNFVIRSNVQQIDGNDVAIDDIRVFQLPKSCANERTVPITIDGSKAFNSTEPIVQNALCLGGQGSIQITAQNFDTATGFFYSTDDGATWNTSTTSPVTITLNAGVYKVIVKNDVAGTCSFSFDSTITAPSAIVASSAVVTQPTCTNGATIRASAVGGSGTYQFELRTADGLTAIAGYEFSSNTDFTNVPAGTYTVVARDVNSCISPASAPITITTPIPPTATLDATSDLCYDTVNGATLVVNASGGTGALSYSLNGQPGQTSATFSNVAPGTHYIDVTDANNCTVRIDGIVIANELIAAQPVVTGLLCDPATDATVTIALTGGTQPYSYTVNGGANVDLAIGTTTITFSTATANTYNFTITDATGCSTTATAIVNAITNPTVNAIPKQVSCNGGTDGEVTLVGSGGSGGFSYSFEGSAFTTTTIYKDLSAGVTYSYEVKDSKGCVGSGTITLTEPTVLEATASATALSCNTSNVKQTALVTVDVPTTGTAPYQYSFNGSIPNNTNTHIVTDNGTDQTINIIVTDQNGCTAATSVIVIGLNPPTDLTFTADPVTCTAPNTTITAIAVNGIAPFTYEITSPAASITTNTDGIFAGLGAGIYNFKVTDANGCFHVDSFEIEPVTPIAIAGNVVNNVLCKGESTGNGTFTVSGNATPGNYTFTLTAGTLGLGTLVKSGNTLTLSNVAVGNYTVEITDSATGCKASASIEITEPLNPLTLTATATNVNCNNFNSQITATAAGGTSGYAYAAVISGTTPAPTVFAANPIIVNTNGGLDLIWDVYAKDANGCIDMYTATIIKDEEPTVTAVLDNQCIATSNNRFTITATGTGLAPLSYSIDGTSFQASNVFTNLTPGTYTVTIKDKNGCTNTATPVTIIERLTANAQTTKELDCSATPNATITTTITGGKAPYSYTITKDSGAPGTPITNVAGPTFTTTIAVADYGSYTFDITDDNGCLTTATATVLEISYPTVSEVHVNVSCYSGTNGSVTLTGAGGLGGYTYSDNATTGFTNNPTFTGLAAGSYTYYVKDSKDCVGSVDVEITEPTQLIADATATSFSCSATNTKQSAVITISVPTTGTAPYKYSFNSGDFTDTNTLTIADNGTDQTISYSIRDANGCIATNTIEILKLDPPTINSITALDITCNVTSSTTTITVSAGVAPLTYTIISGPEINTTGETTGAFTGLVDGDYIFKVTDANGCYDTKSLRINPRKQITVTKQLLNNVDCFETETGSARFTVANTVGTIEFKLYDNLGAEITRPYTVDVTGLIITYTGLGADTYIFTVTDGTTECDASETIIISQPTALSATVASINANCKVGTSKVTVTATGGTKNYQYSFVQRDALIGTLNSSNIANLDPATGLDWDVYIVDAKGCRIKEQFSITTDPEPTVTVSADDQCSGTYIITATPGTGSITPVEFSINNGAHYQSSNTFTVTTAGDYVILMKDANGCTVESDPVTVYPILTLSAVLDKDKTCTVPEAAQITLTATNGNNTSYTYEVYDGTTYTDMANNVFNTIVAGNYTFRVTDANGCIAITTIPITITDYVLPDIFDVEEDPLQPINCNGENSGVILYKIGTTGLAPFVITVTQKTDITYDTFLKDFGTQTSGLPAGFYTITVTDAKGCTDEENVEIKQPDPIVVAHHAVPIICNATTGGISKGSVIVDSVTGGTGPYNYFVTGVNGYNESELNNDGTTSTTFDVVDFGLYQINVVDSNGCSVLIQNVLVASPPDDLDILVDVTSVSCDATIGGKATVSIPTTGSNVTGPGPFWFAIYTGVMPVYPTTPADWIPETGSGTKTAEFTGLTPGVTYTFIVYDTLTGCYYLETAETPIPTNSTLTVTPTVAQNVTCVYYDPFDPDHPLDNIVGADDGKVSFTITNSYSADITVNLEIFNSQSLASTGIIRNVTVPADDPLTVPVDNYLIVTDLGPLPFGNYYVLITEDAGSPNAGCSIATETFNITQSAIPLSVTALVSKKANCNPDSGTITAIAKDGTGPYLYQIKLQTEAAPTADEAEDADWTTPNTFKKDAGSYTVYVKDAYDCIASFNIILEAYDEPTINPIAPICYDGTTAFSIEIVGTVDSTIIGDATYSVNGSAFRADPNFTFNAAGTYNLVIKDGNNCMANVDFVVYPQLELRAVLTEELDCIGTGEALITLTATGGNSIPAANYSYEYSVIDIITGIPGPWMTMTTNTHATSVIGDYIFRVTDGNNLTTCEATTDLTLDPIPTPTIIPTPVAVLCKGDSNGSVTIDVTGGVGPYEYSLDGVAFQPENEFTGLAEGNTYIVTVRDSNQCTYTEGFAITAPDALDAVAAVTTRLMCDPSNDAIKAIVTVTVDPTTGTAPYEYSFDNGVTYTSENTFETFTSGIVAAKVKDTNGCIFDVSATVIALNPPTAMDITGTPIYCVQQGIGDITSTVTINTVTNGVGTLTYTILPSIPLGVTQTGNVFAGLTPGDYTFQVTDENGCTFTDLYTVEDVTKIDVSGQVTKDVTCFGLSNGEAVFTVSNFGTTYTSDLIAGVAGSITQTGDKVTLTGLTAGVTYTIEVTDDVTGCIKTASVIVSQPTAVLAIVPTLVKNANCNYGAKVTAIATGGTPNYKFAYGLTGGTLPVLGDYYDSADAVLDYALGTNWTVYVMDAGGACTAQADFTIDIDDLPTIDLLANIYCYDGSPMPIVITGTGVAPLQYSIGNGYFASPNFTLNAPGNYTFYIKDANGCIVHVPYTLRQELLLQATLTQDLTCDNDATITLLATQGTGPGTYVYEVSTDGGTTFGPIGSTYTTNIAGDYIFRITDGQGCESLLKTITVTPNTTPTFTTAEVHVSCPGGADGSITVTAADGIVPYTYSIDGGPFQTENYFTGLAAGTYSIVVKDAKGCPSVPVDVIITQPEILLATIDVTTPLSCGTGNAAQQAVVTVTVDPTTGTAPYQYSFNGINYSDNNVYKTFTADAVTAYVRDANNCMFTGTLNLTIDALNPPVITTITGTDLWCSAGNTQSTVTITTTNGVGTPTFEILEPASAITNITGATSGIFTGLDAATYLFRVTDANNCIDEGYYTVEPLVNITVSGQEIKTVACNGESNGTLEFKVDNYTGGFTAVLSPLEGTQVISGDTVTITGLAAGTYTLNITDSVTGCLASASATVTEPVILELNLVSNTNATCITDAQVTVEATGGTPTYLYAFKPVGQAPASADYTVNAFAVLDKTIPDWIAYVIDLNMCVAQLPITIETDPLPSGFTATLTSPCQSSTGTFEINIVDGTGMGPYQYSIGSGFQTTPTFTVSTSGNYDIIIKDANECEVTFPLAVTIFEPLALQTNITALPSCNLNDGSIDVSVSGGSGTGNYRFRLDGGAIISADSHTYSGLTFGPHTIIVRDVVTGCDLTYRFDLEEATVITGFALAKTDVTCNGGSNGTITATLAPNAPGVNDNPIYTYELVGTTLGGIPVVRPAQTLAVFTNLEAGNYTVKVISGRGCEDQDDVEITEPDLIVVNAPVVKQFECAAENAPEFATITVDNVVGGSDVYVVYEFFKNGASVQRSASNVYTETDYHGGSYTVTVTDNKGCSGTTTTAIPIAAYINLDEIIIAIDAAIICGGYEDITATVTTTGGTPANLEFKLEGLTDPAFIRDNTDGIFTGLPIGNYLITVSNPATGCSIQRIHYVNNPNTFILDANKISDVICFGSNEGTVELTFIDQIPLPLDEAGEFTYVVAGPTPSTGVSDATGQVTLTGLTAGLYTVTATLVNTPFCEVSTTFTINQPSAALTISETHSLITCISGNNDGKIIVTATGGWAGGYEYEVLKDGNPFRSYSTQTEYPNLEAGLYTINVRDSKGCIDTETVILVIPDPIVFTATPSVSVLSCFGDTNATITVGTPTGGQGSNYMYTLNTVSVTPATYSGPQALPVFNGLGAGIYTITVTDGFSCAETSANIVITEPTKVEASLRISRSQTCLTRTELTLSATGGTAPYRYSTDANFTVPSAQFALSVSFEVPVGTYNYYVRDANGCISFVSNDVKIDPLLPLEMNLDVSDAVVKCTGSATGVIVAEATGGLGNYLYTLQNASGTPIAGPQAEGRFENLLAGVYFVVVESEDCTIPAERVEILEPDEALNPQYFPTDVSCFGEKNGRMEIIATGGTGTIKYAISPDLDKFVSNNIFEKLQAGNYTVIVQDENGCYDVHDFTIEQPDLLFATLTPNSIIPEVCKDDKDGSFTIDIQGGTAPYTAAIDNKNGTYVPVGLQHIFEDLSGGTHTVFIKDALNCTYEFKVVMPDPVVLDPKTIVTYECGADNNQANRIEVTVDASNTDLSLIRYELDGDASTNQASNVFTNLVPGIHRVAAIHENGCYKFSEEFTVLAFDPLTLALSAGQQEMNVISVAAAGGAPNYEYSFNGEPFTSTTTYKIYKSGDYEVIVRDQNGCTATLIVPMTYIDVCIPNYFTPNGDGLYDEWGPGCTNIYNNLEFSIFDRYGRVIAKYRYGQKWDGRYNGEELPTGDYWYVLKLNDNKDAREFVGHFTLYR